MRFVAATNRDLSAMVRDGRFREDLLFRLKVFEILIPPLRQRPEDVAVLTAHFLEELGRRMGRDIEGVSAEAACLLRSYRWPGNGRELRNVLERAVILARTSRIAAIDLPADLEAEESPSCRGTCPLHADGVTEVASLAAVERQYIRCVYDIAGGNKSRAARLLGISRVTLRDKLRQVAETQPDLTAP